MGLNLLFMVPGLTGAPEAAARALLPALVAAGPDVRFTAFVGVEGADDDLGVPTVTVPVRSARVAQRLRGEQVLVPALAHRAGCDVLHSPASTGPTGGRFARVTTAHDLRALTAGPGGPRRLGSRGMTTLAVLRSHRVLVPSAAARAELVTRLPVPAERVDVAAPGLHRSTGVPPRPGALLRRRHRLGDRRVLLALAAKRPEGNLGALLDALARIPLGERPVALLAGRTSSHEEALRTRAAALGLTADVRFPGVTHPADVEGLYALADVFAHPVLQEDSGLPVLEAMARGVPVACSDRGALPEVAGAAALRSDPRDPAALAAAIRRLLGDRREAARLAAAGRERSARFTWAHTAERTLAAYGRALAARG